MGGASRMNRFYDFVQGEEESRLFIEGEIVDLPFAEGSTAASDFVQKLSDCRGPLTVYINSPGGSVIAASEIYSALKDYAGDVTVKITALAASAASVIAMAGKDVLMSPTAIMIVHNPMTVTAGNSEDHERAIEQLEGIKESIVTAYQLKTGLSRKHISDLMDKETVMDARECMRLGFCDGMLYTVQNRVKEKLERHGTHVASTDAYIKRLELYKY